MLRAVHQPNNHVHGGGFDQGIMFLRYKIGIVFLCARKHLWGTRPPNTPTSLVAADNQITLHRISVAMTSSNSLENPDSEKSCVVEYLECPVPTPICSGRDPFYSPIAISFAPKTIQFATPVTHGTLISEFNANLRNGDDTFPIKNFAELVITVRDVYSHSDSSTRSPHPHTVARPQL